MILKYKRYLIILLCVLLVTSEISASTLKDALEEHLKDVAHNEESEAAKLEKEKGEKHHEIDSQIKDSHSNQHSKENDDLKYLKKELESKVSSEKDAYGGYNTKQDKGEDSHSDGFKRGHKKGHHKQGFQNSYHKDESSNKSTFFDDFNDESDQAAYNSKLNNYNNHGGRSYEGSHNNGQEYLRNDYRGGGHNRYGDVGDRHVNHQDHSKKYYLDNTQNHNKYRKGYGSYDRGNIRDRHEYQAPHQEQHYDPGWDRQRWDNRRDWDRSGWDREPEWDRNRDFSGPGYYDDQGIRHDGGYGYGPNHGYGYRYGESRSDPVAEVPRNAPVVARRKQTITIYEDPRYSGKETGKLRREEGDYLELDFQPSSRRYASYDDTYYSVPSGGGAEASKINKLVYNYRRQ